MPLILSWLEATRLPVAAEALRPDALTGLTAAEVARLRLPVGNATAEVGELFTVAGDPADGIVAIEGDVRPLAGLGSGMAAGHLMVRGDAGPRVGAGMTGGLIEVRGRAGDRAGQAMAGGRLHIRGSAGDLLGAAAPGARRGMTDGVILVDGSIGHDAGLGMRRGLIAVLGATGMGLGRGMIAGSVFAFGPVGRGAGAGMKRGTLALFGPRPEVWLGFAPASRYRPPFLALYLRQLRAWGFAVPDAAFVGPVERYNGDRIEGGQGEILLAPVA